MASNTINHDLNIEITNNLDLPIRTINDPTRFNPFINEEPIEFYLKKLKTYSDNVEIINEIQPDNFPPLILLSNLSLKKSEFIKKYLLSVDNGILIKNFGQDLILNLNVLNSDDQEKIKKFLRKEKKGEFKMNYIEACEIFFPSTKNIIHLAKKQKFKHRTVIRNYFRNLIDKIFDKNKFNSEEIELNSFILTELEKNTSLKNIKEKLFDRILIYSNTDVALVNKKAIKFYFGNRRLKDFNRWLGQHQSLEYSYQWRVIHFN
ncbi:MAG: hypothetical protein EAX96_06575 [Candidatus Lokiarchaeota archaeon]|nr:hypothetical protein [Candidatus Lokiarchaeota archaeon]